MSTSRITYKFLHAQVERLNALTGHPDEIYTYDGNGKITGGNAGTYLLDGAYGGWALHRMCTSTGQSDVFQVGHVSARELSGLISAYIRGIMDTRKEAAE